MIITGRHNSATIYTDVIEEHAISQIKQICDEAAFAKSKIRIMPDVHAGAGCTIGTTMTIIDKIVPNMVGVDIGCGMEVAELNARNIDFAKLDKLIYDNIPFGMTCRKKQHAYASKVNLKELKCYSKINAELAYRSVGTLGGGNHFIEVDTDENGSMYLIVHSGSRHLGLEVANYYQTQAYKTLSGNSDTQIKEIIARLKAQGKQQLIELEIEKAKKNKAKIDPDMAYLTGTLFKDYIHDMKIIQNYAVVNRQAMVDEIVVGLGLTVKDCFTTIHNYIDTENMILRKGAVSAQKKERLIIPINMRDGSLICEGKGNVEWNFSAPHGAGRLLSRSKAFATLSMKDYEHQMEGIYTTSVCKGTLDESPMAYKKIEDIIDNIAPTVEIQKRIKPVYNFKASDDIKRQK